ncbi:unnamed protein product [Ranitomeya imitator]|uniref:CCHC-type domain-containing protein n=1 Tax=Ranitomeya imitator TaxID=111125 RepID=A0ABN9L043_9NEOB|nr:unnamed protein product [Ranitomeya imitator]
MATGEEMNYVPQFAKVRNAIRLVVREGFRGRKDYQFVMKEVILDLFKVKIEDVIAIMDYPKKGVYDIVFQDKFRYEDYLRRMTGDKDGRMEGINVIPHFPLKEKLVIIKMYSPFVEEEDIITFLSFFCKSVVPKGKILNEFGFWTSKWRFLVQFKVDSQGELFYPPARFKIGSINGDFFFNGLPICCRICGRYGHGKDACPGDVCGFCKKSDHVSKDCKNRMRCNLCFDSTHVFKNCPKRKKAKDVMGKKHEVTDETKKVQEENGAESEEGKKTSETKKESAKEESKRKPDIVEKPKNVQVDNVEVSASGGKMKSGINVIKVNQDKIIKEIFEDKEENESDKVESDKEESVKCTDESDSDATVDSAMSDIEDSVSEVGESSQEVEKKKQEERQLIYGEKGQEYYENILAKLIKVREPPKADEWKHVTKRSKKTMEKSPTTQLKNRYQIFVEDEDGTPKNEAIPASKKEKGTQQQVTAKSTAKKQRRVVVVGDSLLRGTEAAICRPDITAREVCCLPGAMIKDVTDKIPKLFSSKDVHPFLLIHVGTNDTARKDLPTICKDFEELGKKVKELDAQTGMAPGDGTGSLM